MDGFLDFIRNYWQIVTGVALAVFGYFADVDVIFLGNPFTYISGLFVGAWLQKVAFSMKAR